MSKSYNLPRGFLIIVFLSPFLSIGQLDSVGFKMVNNRGVSEINEEVAVIEDQKGIMNLEVLDPELGRFNVFLSGENHTWYDDNGVVKLELLTYLNQNAGVNRYLMEFGPTTGWIINEYVMDRDTSLEVIFNMLPNRSYKKLFRKIRAYNRKQPDSLKIQVVGVDAQKIASMLILYVDYLRGDKKFVNAHDSIQLSLEALYYDVGDIKRFNPNFDSQITFYNSARSTYDDAKSSTLDNFLSNYKRFTNHYNSFFGKDSTKLQEVMETLDGYQAYEDYTDNSKPYLDIFREREMIRRLKENIALDSTAKYYGQFGKCHIASIYAEKLCDRYNFTCFADRINQDSLFNVLTIGTAYKMKGDVEYMNDSLQAQFKAFLDEGLDSIKIVKYESIDSLGSQPDYVLINPHEEATTYSVETADGNKSDFIWKGSWMLHYSLNFEMSNIFLTQDDVLKFDLSPTESIDISSHIQTFGFSYKYIADAVFYFNVDYKGRLLEDFTINDSLSVNFSNYQSSVLLGYEFTPTSLFNISSYGGVGLGQASLSFDYEDAQTEYLIGDNDFKIYNYYYILDIGSDLDFTFGVFNLGVRGGYQYDFSPREWQNDASSKKSNFSGAYWSAFAGLTLLIE